MTTLNKLNSLNLTLLMSTRKSLVTAVAFLITSVILVVLGFGQISSFMSSREKLATTQKKVDQLNEKVQKLDQLKFTPEYAQAERMNEVLPSHKPLLELLNNLNSVANRTGISITEFQINPGEIATQAATTATPVQKRRAGDYDKLDLELGITGQLSQVQEFMSLIERVSPITTITDLIIDRKANALSQAQQLTRADLSLSTYYYTKPITATLSAPLPSITAEERSIFQEILAFTPPQSENQTQIIGGNNTDLFGIKGLSVSDLERQIEPDLSFTQ